MEGVCEQQWLIDRSESKREMMRRKTVKDGQSWLRNWLIRHMQCEGTYFDGQFVDWLITYFVIKGFKRRA
jgi:hypothetical protein